MIMLIIMLIIALVPTAHYAWDSPAIIYGTTKNDDVRPQATDYAICFFNSHSGTCTYDNWYRTYCSQAFEASQQRMVLSALFLAVGMLNRLWHLFKLPTRIYIGARIICSHKSTLVLSRFHSRISSWPFWLSCFAAFFFYYPFLAMFLTIRLLVDMMTSRAFEVSSMQALYVHKVLTITDLVADRQLLLGFGKSVDAAYPPRRRTQ
jgi:hypothetical protein